MPEVLFGAQKMVVAEWNTWMFVMLPVTGQWERGGSIEHKILVVEKKVPDKVVKVHLSYMLPECVELSEFHLFQR